MKMLALGLMTFFAGWIVPLPVPDYCNCEFQWYWYGGLTSCSGEYCNAPDGSPGECDLWVVGESVQYQYCVCWDDWGDPWPEACNCYGWVEVEMTLPPSVTYHCSTGACNVSPKKCTKEMPISGWDVWCKCK